MKISSTSNFCSSTLANGSSLKLETNNNTNNNNAIINNLNDQKDNLNKQISTLKETALTKDSNLKKL